MDELKNIKIGLVGDTSIGKTSFTSYIANEPFIEQYIQTIGVDLKVLYLDNLKLKFTFWDLSGHYMFNDLVDNFVNSLNVVCFCFAVDNVDSYNYMLQKYVQYYESDILKDKLCIVLQLKCDTIHNLDICKSFCTDNNIKTFTTSSLKPFGKEEFIIYLIKLFYTDETNQETNQENKKDKENNCIIN